MFVLFEYVNSVLKLGSPFNHLILVCLMLTALDSTQTFACTWGHLPSKWFFKLGSGKVSTGCCLTLILFLLSLEYIQWNDEFSSIHQLLQRISQSNLVYSYLLIWTLDSMQRLLKSSWFYSHLFLNCCWNHCRAWCTWHVLFKDIEAFLPRTNFEHLLPFIL